MTQIICWILIFAIIIGIAALEFAYRKQRAFDEEVRELDAILEEARALRWELETANADLEKERGRAP